MNHQMGTMVILIMVMALALALAPVKVKGFRLQLNIVGEYWI